MNAGLDRILVNADDALCSHSRHLHTGLEPMSMELSHMTASTDDALRNQSRRLRTRSERMSEELGRSTTVDDSGLSGRLPDYVGMRRARLGGWRG